MECYQINSYQERMNVVNYNLELGVNTFDHSNQFGEGQIEKLFGDAISRKSFKQRLLSLRKQVSEGRQIKKIYTTTLVPSTSLNRLMNH